MNRTVTTPNTIHSLQQDNEIRNRTTITMCPQPEQLLPLPTPTLQPKATEDSVTLKKTKRCVRFVEESNQTQVISPLFTQVHPSCLYYTAQELRAQKEADIESLRQAILCDYELRDDQQQEDAGVCVRGLEEYYCGAAAHTTTTPTKSSSSPNRKNPKILLHNKHAFSDTAPLERREHNRQFVLGVLEVQNEKREWGLSSSSDADALEMYMVSRTSSKRDRKQARQRAQQDAQFVLVQAQQEQAEERRHPEPPQRRRSSALLMLNRRVTHGLSSMVNKAFTTSSRNLKKVGILCSAGESNNSSQTHNKAFPMFRRNKTL